VLIDEGRVIADGSFDELRNQQGEGSLERIFSNLTANRSMQDAAADVMKAFEN